MEKKPLDTGQNGNCARCHFWLKKEDESGECRKNAPAMIRAMVVKDSPTVFWRIFPFTGQEDWCGEFKEGNGKDRVKRLEIAAFK